ARAWALANLGNAHLQTLRATSAASSFLMITGDIEGGVAALREALAIAQRIYPAASLPCVKLRLNLGETCFYAGQLDAACAELEPLLKELCDDPPEDSLTLPRVQSALGRTYLVAGRRDEGLALVRAALADQLEQAGPADA